MNHKQHQVIRQLKNNDPYTYEALVEDYGNKLYRLAFVILGDLHLAEDVVQESFLALYKNISSFRGDSAVTTWLTRVTINNAKNILRRKKLKSIFFTEAVIVQDLSPPPDEALELTEIQREIKDIMFSLPLKYRDVLYLHYYEEMKLKAIADILDLSESGVKSRLQRGREYMKKLLLERSVY